MFIIVTVPNLVLCQGLSNPYWCVPGAFTFVGWSRIATPHFLPFTDLSLLSTNLFPLANDLILVGPRPFSTALPGEYLSVPAGAHYSFTALVALRIAFYSRLHYCTTLLFHCASLRKIVFQPPLDSAPCVAQINPIRYNALIL